MVEFCIDESCKSAFLSFNVFLKLTYRIRLYKFDFGKPVSIDPTTDKSYVMEVDGNAMVNPGDNSIAIYNNRFGTLEAR